MYTRLLRRVLHALFQVNTQEGDSRMMFRNWMIGACVAVAAMAISGEAEAQGVIVGHSDVFFIVDNHSTRPIVVTLRSPKEEMREVKRPDWRPEFERLEQAVAPRSKASFVHQAVEPTEKMASRAHYLEVRDAKTKAVLYKRVVSMSKPFQPALDSKSPVEAAGYHVAIRKNLTVDITTCRGNNVPIGCVD
jgi:hypothetical protein